MTDDQEISHTYRFGPSCGVAAIVGASSCAECGMPLAQSVSPPNAQRSTGAVPAPPSAARGGEQPGSGYWQAPSGKWFAPDKPPHFPRQSTIPPRGCPGPGYWQDPDAQWHPPDTPPYIPSPEAGISDHEPLLSPEDLLAGRGSVDPRILRKLNDAKRVAQCQCLECGYSGLMTLIGSKRPWYGRWYFLILICLTGVGILVLIAIGVIIASNTKLIYICPNCDRRLTSR